LTLDLLDPQAPQVLDFGNVYVKSTAVKSFSVFNDLPQAALL
jgi:hypothetical protein